jgi:D-amino-acid dehydrogenase
MKICILGAGVVGVTSAYMLASRGHEVTVLDRQPDAARECSYANGGQLSYSHAEPWANPHVFPKLIRWMWQEDAPLVLRFWMLDGAKALVGGEFRHFLRGLWHGFKGVPRVLKERKPISLESARKIRALKGFV